MDRNRDAGGRFEMRLAGPGMCQILTGVNHPQTNGNLERLHGEIQCMLRLFEEIMIGRSDPMDLFMQWYNTTGPRVH